MLGWFRFLDVEFVAQVVTTPLLASGRATRDRPGADSDNEINSVYWWSVSGGKRKRQDHET